MSNRKDPAKMIKEAKFKHYTVFVPPVFGEIPREIRKYPMPGESYSYNQMVDVLAIFDKRWKSAGSTADREPYATPSEKDGFNSLKDLDSRLTRDGIYSEIASEAFIEAVAEKESSNLLINNLLRLDCSSDDADDLDEDVPKLQPQGGGQPCPKGKEEKKRKKKR